ncbi:alpha/beta hydrolase [Paenibacillus sp. N1-5-1-14]|uniref:alpha/beta hydrolase n=1 Tax=Paenibacillus radicibacter TaxID=2972488 RepID=UPI002159010F|nr:alpha/beta hydrolase [Paenibacillus radicibacter]MCR8645346.1 alpha/beta hydrolase [Paenibacillus radicibacter]
MSDAQNVIRNEARLQQQIRPKRRRRWIGISAVILIVILLLGVFGISGYVGWNLTHPVKDPLEAKPEDLQLAYTNVEFNSAYDETLLRGWLIPAGDTKDRIVIFSHGFRGNRSGEKPALPTAKALKEQGIASLLFDFRNSGESEGTVTSVGLYEKSDLLAAINYAKSLGYTKIGLVGYSMGAVVSLNAAPEASDVQAVIADSPFADLRPYLEENLPVWSNLPAFPFTPLVIWETTLMTGLDPDKVRPIESITKLKDKPVMLIHTTNDGKIPASNSEQLMKASGSPNTSLWLVEGDKHVGAYDVKPDEYLAKVTQFFSNNLK